ncbi:MAG: alginate lyase family protein, partial [Bacteroidota bacterium]
MSVTESVRIIKYRIVLPGLWNWFVVRKLKRLSDAEFWQFFPPSKSTEENLEEFKTQTRMSFFFHPRNQKDFFLELLERSQSRDSIVDEAREVLENKFETLGSGLVRLGEKISWNTDFKTGKEWPLKLLKKEEILDLDHPSDIKVPWELSRFHQVWWLGKAYWLNHDERYAEKFKALVEDWIDKNPLGQGVNWVNAMEVAIRASNWIAGYYFFCESKSIPPGFWIKFLKSLYLHGTFIEYHQEYSWRNGNHLLSDIVGLVFLGIFFRQATFGRKWLDSGVTSLHREMEEQVCPDGVDYEKSTSYHRLVLELFYSATILCQRNSIQFTQEYLKRLEQMFEFVAAYSRPDGSVPLFGDSDDGRLFRFIASGNVNDHRHALSVGAILFERPDFKSAAGRFHQDSLWLFGGEGFEVHQRLRSDASSPSSKSFPDGGFYCMQGKDMHVLVDAGDLGQKGMGGHGHNDVLSFELWAHGESLIVDSGTYAYTFDPIARQQFRGTRAHNTIVVDGIEIAEFDGLWRVHEDRTKPRVTEWSSSDEEDVLEAEHHAYETLSSPVVHRRRFS